MELEWIEQTGCALSGIVKLYLDTIVWCDTEVLQLCLSYFLDKIGFTLDVVLCSKYRTSREIQVN